MGLTLLVPHERQPSDRSFLTWKIVRVFLSLSAVFVGLTFLNLMKCSQQI